MKVGDMEIGKLWLTCVAALLVTPGVSHAQISTGPSGVLGGGASSFGEPEYLDKVDGSGLSLPNIDKYVPQSQRHTDQLKISDVNYVGANIPEMREIVDGIIENFKIRTQARRTSILEISVLRDEITQAYIQEGYINSGAVVPRQDLSDGVLDIQITEGRLTEVPVSFQTPTLLSSLGIGEDVTARVITDSNNNGKLDVEDQESLSWRPGQLRRSYILGRLSAEKDKPLNQFDLQKKFQSLSNDPAIEKIDAALTPGERPGEARLFLDVQESDPFWLYLTTASERAPSIGGERLAIGGGFRNLLGYGDVITFQAGLSEGLKDSQARYDLPVGSSRFALNAHIQYSDAEVVEEPLSNLNILSESFSYGGGVSARLADGIWSTCNVPTSSERNCEAENTKSSSYGLQAALDISKKKTENALLGVPFSFSPGAVDGKTNNLVLIGSLDGSVRSSKQVAAARLSISFGLDSIDTVQMNAPSKNFMKLGLQTQFARVVSEKYGHQLVAKFNGQWTDETLFTSERFAFGGIDSVRGYRKNDVLTDRGIAASIEYRLSLNPLLENAQTRFFDDWSVGVFVDGGYGENTVFANPGTNTLASIGAQLNFKVLDGMSGQVYYGHQLEEISSPRNSTLQDKGFGFRLTFTGVNL